MQMIRDKYNVVFICLYLFKTIVCKNATKIYLSNVVFSIHIVWCQIIFSHGPSYLNPAKNILAGMSDFCFHNKNINIRFILHLLGMWYRPYFYFCTSSQKARVKNSESNCTKIYLHTFSFYHS